MGIVNKDSINGDNMQFIEMCDNCNKYIISQSPEGMYNLKIIKDIHSGNSPIIELSVNENTLIGLTTACLIFMKNYNMDLDKKMNKLSLSGIIIYKCPKDTDM